MAKSFQIKSGTVQVEERHILGSSKLGFNTCPPALALREYAGIDITIDHCDVEPPIEPYYKYEWERVYEYGDDYYTKVAYNVGPKLHGYMMNYFHGVKPILGITIEIQNKPRFIEIREPINLLF